MLENFGFINIIDIVVLGLLLYLMFRLLKGTTAFTVSIGLYILLAKSLTPDDAQCVFKWLPENIALLSILCKCIKKSLPKTRLFYLGWH